jgi:novobiocin biosynthesis protein NovU/D-mycarose 3-C-methyltransferase
MRIANCRACDSPSLWPFLDLGDTALANNYVVPARADEPEPTYPLRAALCAECGLVQIDEEVPPEDLFRHYLYVSGTSDLVHQHARELAEHFARRCPLRRGDLVLEAASNDGTVLKAFQRYGARTLGIEPARNIAEQATREGVPTVCEFFDAATARQARAGHGPARLILARHVLAHARDLHGFVEGLFVALADDGLAVVEVPHLLTFHDYLAYDTVYHEHLCYFSLRVLQRLFRRHGLELADVLEVPIHGGSIVVSAQRHGGPRPRSAAVDELLAREERAGLHRLERWARFARRVEQNRDALCREVDRLWAAGRSLAGYGAAAKGMTLLAYCGIGPDQLPYLVDKNPYKQGLLTPGHHIPICPPERLLQEQPDTVLLLAWNFAAEIARQQAEYLRRGGRFLLPLPAPRYWAGAAAPPWAGEGNRRAA